MTHNEIIEYLHGVGIVEKFRKVVPWSVFDDFVQFCYLELYSKDAERLTALYERGKLEGYFFRICRNVATDRRRKFYRDCGLLPMWESKKIRFVHLCEALNDDDDDGDE